MEQKAKSGLTEGPILQQPFMCLELMAIGAISGMGNTKLCSLISIVLTGLRIPMAYALSATGLGVDGVWWALAISSILKGITLHVAFYWVCKRNGLKRVSQEVFDEGCGYEKLLIFDADGTLISMYIYFTNQVEDGYREIAIRPKDNADITVLSTGRSSKLRTLEETIKSELDNPDAFIESLFD